MQETDQILDAPEVQDIQLRYAGFWIRVGAYLIDAILLFPLNFLIGLALGEDAPQAVASLISLLIGLCYFGGMESSSYQATLGKMAAEIRVGDANGHRISFANALGRYLGKIISGILIGIGFMMVGWDERKQGIHDKLADTFVFYRR